jgi:serine/threonine protein kinase
MDDLSLTLDKRFQLLEVLGKGGFATVYRALDKQLGRESAIKILTQFKYDKTALLRFEREAKTLCTLQHPGIVTFYSYGLLKNHVPYTVVEKVQGVDLKALISKDLLTPREITRIALETCRALQYCHREGVIHRDLKPENILITKDGSVKVLDFGICALMPERGQSQLQLTQNGETVGSAYYMSPEQVRGDKLDGRSDVYALGCIIYECSTRKPPFGGSTAIEIMYKHLETPPDIAAMPSDTVEAKHLREVVVTALQKDRSKRFANAQAMLESLQTPGTGFTRRGKSHGRVITGLISILVAVFATAVFLFTSTNHRPIIDTKRNYELRHKFTVDNAFIRYVGSADRKLDQHDPLGAIEDYKKALKAPSADADLIKRRLIPATLDAGDFQQAQALVTEVYKTDPAVAPLFQHVIDRCQNAKLRMKFAHQDIVLMGTSITDPKNIEVFIAIASQLTDGRQLQRAHIIAHNIVRQTPKEYPLFLNLLRRCLDRKLKGMDQDLQLCERFGNEDKALLNSFGIHEADTKIDVIILRACESYWPTEKLFSLWKQAWHQACLQSDVESAEHLIINLGHLVFRGLPVSDEFVLSMKKEPIAKRIPGMFHLLETRRYYVKDDFANALQHCNEAIRLGPPVKETVGLRAELLRRLNRTNN